MKDGSPQSAAIESAPMVYIYALEHLGFEQAYFDVRKSNTKVWQFHERFGAERIHETDSSYIYKLKKPAILSSIHKYKKYAALNLSIENL